VLRYLTSPSITEHRSTISTMKIVVTGCNGTVGSAVVKLALKRGHTVLGIDTVETEKKKPWSCNPGYVFKKLDLQDFDATLDALRGYDAVISLAACRNPGDYKVTTHNM
jgi:nucleoside-diphosphate-sugar epimerase